MKILQVSATDFGGGAAKVAWDLHHAYVELGHYSKIAVGKKKTSNSNVVQIPNGRPRNSWEVLTFEVANQLKKQIGRIPGAGRSANFFAALGRPENSLAYLLGRELFNYPASHDLLDLFSNERIDPSSKAGMPNCEMRNCITETPDIVHAHNLHSKYFDLRSLPQLSHQVPTIFTLHDTWLLSGHCAYSVTCDRWQSGCGKCPDLSLYPAIRRDNTAINWNVKKQIYKQSRLYVVTPCAWLMNKVKQSMLQDGIALQRVIHNGVDVSRFCPPVDKNLAKKKIGVSKDEYLILFVANSVRNNIWKDFITLKRALEILSEKCPTIQVRLICFGDENPPEYAGHIPIIFEPHTDDLNRVIDFYQAADVYVHATKADTFPTVILEALACGLPVIATAVDGITEQVKSLVSVSKVEPFSEPPIVTNVKEATGVLVSRGENDAIAHWLSIFIKDCSLRQQLSENARNDAIKRFDFKRQVEEYLAWYENCMLDFHCYKKELAIEHKRGMEYE
ncbi:glycosyltransferase [Candidatus Dependentiae bacterium]|nr:glycosyltransferase [Candidatus Dependentiae bacterium]